MNAAISHLESWNVHPILFFKKNRPPHFEISISLGQAVLHNQTFNTTSAVFDVCLDFKNCTKNM